MGFGCCQTPKSGISHSNFRFSRFRIFHDFASFIFMLHFVYVHHITCYDYFFEVLLSACIVGDPLPRPPLGGNATLAATKRHLGHSHPAGFPGPRARRSPFLAHAGLLWPLILGLLTSSFSSSSRIQIPLRILEWFRSSLAAILPTAQAPSILRFVPLLFSL